MRDRSSGRVETVARVGSGVRRERVEERPRGEDHVFEKLLIVIQVAFVLRRVAPVMSLGEHAPVAGGEPHGMRQRLKDDVAFVGPVPEPPESIEREGVRGVVAQVEPTLEGKVRALRVGEPTFAGLPEAVELSRGGRLPLETADTARGSRAQTRSSVDPVTNSLGLSATLATNPSGPERFRLHSPSVMRLTFTVRPSSRSASASASKSVG